jgi:hypothetical protein
VHANFTIKRPFSCSPDMDSVIVGRGSGQHPEHPSSVQNGSSVIIEVNDTSATSFDWIFSGPSSTSCDYDIRVAWQVVCGPPPPTPPPPPPTPSPSGLATWLTWWATLNSTAVKKGGRTLTSVGVAAWDTAPGSKVNKTAWSGPNSFVADFNAQIVYNTQGKVCEFTCQMEGGENSCDSSMDGNALCGYDYVTRSKYVGNVTMPDGKLARHYHYSDPLGPISMADHDVFIGSKEGTPLRMAASFHPFGEFVMNVTSDYNDFKTTSPPAAYFEVTQIKYCEPGSSQDCANSLKRVRQLGMQAPAPLF